MYLAISCILTVCGGLGIFLLGMKHLSEGLQAVGGGGLRRFMGLATTHRLAGVGTGIVSTLIVQSSSIIIVMLVGFVSSGMMTLRQAINVIIGANIGTTGTVWIVAFAPSPMMLGLIGMAIGGILYFFVGRTRWHDAGLAVLGLGLVFLGLYYMSKGVLPIRENPDVASLFRSMDASSYGGIAVVALGAAAFTAVIQSSAATIAIAMTLASQQLISYEVAVAVLFGANVGTTMTGWLATIGASREAKQTALAHTLSNVFGSIVFLPAVPLLVDWGKALFPNWNVVETVVMGGKDTQVLAHVMAPIALTDTVFSVLRGIATFVLARPFARLVEKVVPAENEERPHLEVRSALHLSPVLACDQAVAEVAFMRDSVLDMLACVRRVLAGTATGKDETHIVHREEVLDRVQREVSEFLGHVFAKRLSPDVAERARRMLRLADELESVSDEAATILKVTRRLRQGKLHLSPESQEELLAMHDRVQAFAEAVSHIIVSPRPPIDLSARQADSQNVHRQIRLCRQRRLESLAAGDAAAPARVLVELDVLNAYARIGSYYMNIVETLAGGKACERS